MPGKQITRIIEFVYNVTFKVYIEKKSSQIYDSTRCDMSYILKFYIILLYIIIYYSLLILIIREKSQDNKKLSDPVNTFCWNMYM